MDNMINKLQPDIEPKKEENQSKGKQFFDNMMYALNDVKELTKEIDFKGKIKKAGEYVSDKTEQIQNSQAFNRFMTAVSYGIDNVIQKTDKLLFKNDNKIIPIPQNYINPSLINNNINQINKSNYSPISVNQNQNNIINNNIHSIKETEPKNINLNSNNPIKKEEEKNNIIKNDFSQQNKEKNLENKEEKLDGDETNLKNSENNIEEKIDENDENAPNNILIMSNNPNPNHE